MKKLYDVVSKATKINRITGAEIPVEDNGLFYQ